jgi:hypothetical protein
VTKGMTAASPGGPPVPATAPSPSTAAGTEAGVAGGGAVASGGGGSAAVDMEEHAQRMMSLPVNVPGCMLTSLGQWTMSEVRIPPCIVPFRILQVVTTSSKYCTMVQYLTPLRYLSF